MPPAGGLQWSPKVRRILEAKVGITESRHSFPPFKALLPSMASLEELDHIY